MFCIDDTQLFFIDNTRGISFVQMKSDEAATQRRP
jgi:hypothetical protein